MDLKKILSLFLCLVWFSSTANAHRQNESYVYLNITETGLGGRIEIRLSDLGQLIPLDKDADGIVTQEEFTAGQSEVYAFFEPRLVFGANGQKYPITITSHEFLEVGFGTFAEIHFSTAIQSKLPDAISVEYNSYFENLAPGHRVLLLIESNTKIGLNRNESSHSLIFSSGLDKQTLSLIGAPWYKIFWTFLKHGVVHILIGYDHVAFLLTLLLSSVLVVNARRFAPVPRFRDALINVLKIATLFTIAHSITLSLAAIGWLNVPERLIESLIALSIIIVAFANLFAFKKRWVWVAVFTLGLVHGFGFASVLAPLGIASSSIVWSLLAFNVGVEIGQGAIIAVCFPVLFLLRGSSFYIPVILRGGSVILLLIAVLWFVERAFQFDLPVMQTIKALFS